MEDLRKGHPAPEEDPWDDWDNDPLYTIPSGRLDGVDPDLEAIEECIERYADITNEDNWEYAELSDEMDDLLEELRGLGATNLTTLDKEEKEWHRANIKSVVAEIKSLEKEIAAKVKELSRHRKKVPLAATVETSLDGMPQVSPHITIVKRVVSQVTTLYRKKWVVLTDKTSLPLHARTPYYRLCTSKQHAERVAQQFKRSLANYSYPHA